MIYDVDQRHVEFPHTDEKKFQQITDLTLKNVAICPFAYIVEEMKKNCRYRQCNVAISFSNNQIAFSFS
jgi:hypothetical protein